MPHAVDEQPPTQPVKETTVTTLKDNNYRTQDEIKCCTTCRHVYKYGPYIECMKIKAGIQVCELGICDKYEREEEVK